MMDFEYGKIEAVKEFDKPFTISQKVAYKTVSRKFNVFNVKYLKQQLGESLQIGARVKFTTIMKEGFYNLASSEESEFSECFGCGAYTPLRQEQQMECEKCYGPMKKSKLDKDLKLVKKKITKFPFSFGITLSFIDEKEECLINHLHTSNTFENSAIYHKLCELEKGDRQHVLGWVSQENDYHSFCKIVDIDDTQDNS